MKKIFALAVSILVSGCAHDFLKQVESRAYDKVASTMSKYCENADSDLIVAERIQMRREIRQRGDYGPPGGIEPGLDFRTMHGKGPVVRIWCEEETVPSEVWKDLIR